MMWTQATGILALPAPLLVGLTWLSIYLLVISRSISISILNSIFFNLIILTLIHHVRVVIQITSCYSLTIYKINNYRVFNCLSIQFIIHNQRFTVWQEHKPLWYNLILWWSSNILNHLIVVLAWVVDHLIIRSILTCILFIVSLGYLLSPLASTVRGTVCLILILWFFGSISIDLINSSLVNTAVHLGLYF